MVKLKKRQIKDLKIYENNPRRNEKAVEALEESVKKFGVTNPIIINPENVILAGHTRLLAFKKAGVEEVECVVVDDLAPEQEKAFRIADNRVAELSSWDSAILLSEMKTIDADDWEKFGFKERDVKQLDPPEECICPRCGKRFVKV